MPCNRTVWPESPLVDCDSSYTYVGRSMGLYGNNSNVRPSEIETSVQNAVGSIDLEQPFGVALIGQSTALTTYNALLAMPEFISAKRDNAKFVNCAHGGYEMEEWSHGGAIGWPWLVSKLAAAGLTSNQIKVVILINTFSLDYIQNPTTLTARLNAYAVRTKSFRDTCKVKLPNNVVIYSAGLHPLYRTGGEPGAGYESSIAFRDSMLLPPIVNDPPLLAGWYQWSQGNTPNAEGVQWPCPDYYLTDGVHPNTVGALYAAGLLFNFLNNDSTTGWFRI